MCFDFFPVGFSASLTPALALACCLRGPGMLCRSIQTCVYGVDVFWFRVSSGYLCWLFLLDKAASVLLCLSCDWFGLSLLGLGWAQCDKSLRCLVWDRLSPLDCHMGASPWGREHREFFLSLPALPNESVDELGVLPAVGTVTGPKGGAKVSRSSACQCLCLCHRDHHNRRERQRGSLRACGL